MGQRSSSGSLAWDPFAWKYKDVFVQAATEMQVVQFKTLLVFGRIPRSSDCVTVNYHSFPRTQIVLIFVSHRWLRPHGSSRWPEGDPDDDENSKYNLLIAGLRKIRGMLVPGLDEDNIFLWIDFACIDQVHVNSNGIPWGMCALDYYIKQSDAIFTPVFDTDTSWFQPGSLTDSVNIFNAYASASWKEYWMRGWCRLEAFCAAVIPCDPDSNPVFAAEALRGKRPHLLYGTREFESRGGLRILPALLGRYLDQYDPASGDVTKEADRATLSRFRDRLSPYLKNEDPPEYFGDVDEDGLPHGQGRVVAPDYTVYEGQFRHGVKHGSAQVQYANGMSFLGEYKEGQRHGMGKEFWPSGHLRYIGGYRNGHRYGKGELYDEDGAVIHDGLFPEPQELRRPPEFRSMSSTTSTFEHLDSYTMERFGDIDGHQSSPRAGSVHSTTKCFALECAVLKSEKSMTREGQSLPRTGHGSVHPVYSSVRRHLRMSTV